MSDPASLQEAQDPERQFVQQLKALAPRTWVTWAIVALNLAAWIATLVAGADPLQPDVAQLLALGGNTAWNVQHGQWWRLLTSAFLHIGVLHLAVNMLGLLLVAPTVERIYGHRLFLLLYLGCALAGSAASLHFSARSGVSVGASGAVFGVAGALLAAVFHHRRRLPRKFGKRTLGGIGFFVLYSLAQGLAPGVDNAAHVGGLLAGVALALILPERFDAAQLRRRVGVRAAAAALFIVAFTAAIAVSAPRAPLDVGAALAASDAVGRALREFSQAVGELEAEARDVRSGKLAEADSDARSRRVHAPRFRALAAQLSAIALPANDPRAPLLAVALRMAQLLQELLAMDSRAEGGKLVPVDPARWSAINAELEALNAQLSALSAQSRQR
jgi:rhomboid protease GluP